MVTMGRSVDSKPTERPEMMLVATPVTLLFAMVFTGR